MIKFIDVAVDQKDAYVVKEPGEHVFFLFNVSGEITFDVQTPDADVKILGAYVGRSGDDFKLHTIQNHAVGRSVSDLYVKGVFFDDSKFDYSGLIKIEKGANETEAEQTNRNIIMSEKALVSSEPYLEILADDVKCAHASTTGKLSDDQLYYLMARGIEQEKAKQLLAEGFVLDIFEKIEALGFGDQVAEYKKQANELAREQYVH